VAIPRLHLRVARRQRRHGHPRPHRIPVAAFLRVGDAALSESTTVDLEAITPSSPTLLLTIAVEDLLGDARPT